MKLVVTTQKKDDGWHGTCWRMIGHTGTEEISTGPCGESGAKNSEAAAASGAIGDHFRKMAAR